MREILFRGKRLDNGEWAEGFYQASPTGHHYITTIGAMGCAAPHKVDPATVGQYTGLKDKNGREIFEDDIIEWDPFMMLCGVVGFDEGGFCANGHFLSDEIHFGEFYGQVIGNIHDNPDLIERG